MFHELHHVERGTLTLNLLLLMVVSFIPYPIALLGRCGPLPASAVYGVVLTPPGDRLQHILASHLERNFSESPVSLLNLRRTSGRL
jgi:uncharacterized membrane protein